MNNKKSDRTSKMTIDKLAIMMNNNFEKLEEKMATKDDLKSLETRMNGKFEGLDKRIDDFVVTRVKYDDHNKLKARVGALESKLK